MKSVTEVLFNWIRGRQDNRGFYEKKPWWEGFILQTVCEYPAKISALELQAVFYKRELQRLELKLKKVLEAAALVAPEETAGMARRKT
jgi:hypothetical protein